MNPAASLLLLLVLLASASALAFHGGPHPATLALSVPNLRVGEEVAISATLRHPDGEPVANATVVFELDTTYGVLELGRAATNARGKASVLYVPAGPGSFTFRARFEGAPGLDAAADEKDVDVGEAPPAPSSLPTATAIAFVVAIIVGSIWGIYGFILLDLRQVWVEGGGTPFLKKRKEVRTK